MRQSLLWGISSFTLISAQLSVSEKRDGFSKRQGQSFSVVLYEVPIDGVDTEGVPAIAYTQQSVTLTAAAPNILITIEQEDQGFPVFYDDFSLTTTGNATNVLVNPGFENGLFPWFEIDTPGLANGARVSTGSDLIPSQTSAHTGSFALVDNAIGTDGVEQLVTVTSGSIYTLTFWNAVPTAIPTGIIQVSFTNVFPPSSLQLTAATDTGTSNFDGVTDAPIPVLFGYGDVAGAQINIYLNGTFYGSNITQSDLTFLLNLVNLPAGATIVTATEVVGSFAETVNSAPFILTYSLPGSTTPSPSLSASGSAASSVASLLGASPSLQASPSSGISSGFLSVAGSSSTIGAFPTGNSSASNNAGTVGSESITSTIYDTVTYTITSCAPTVTDCPLKIGQVTTQILSYTTVVPCTLTYDKPQTTSYLSATSTYSAPSSDITTSLTSTITTSITSVVIGTGGNTPFASSPVLFTGASDRRGISGAAVVVAGLAALL